MAVAKFDLKTFAENPTSTAIYSMTKSELLEVAAHYEVNVVKPGLRKDEIRTLVLEYCVEHGILSKLDTDSHRKVNKNSDLELQRLRIREKELELRTKELGVREFESRIRLRELELQQSQATEQSTGFDVSKHIRLVPPFQESEVDRYFLHFEKVACSLKWPVEVWTLLLQSVLVGKAQDVYSALSKEQSADYKTVKFCILQAYQLVPEAYRQQFRHSSKQMNQTHVEFAGDKENMFNRWCKSMNVGDDFEKLKQLILMEEFKNCVHGDVKTHLGEHRVESLNDAAILADDYALIHRLSFGNNRKAQDIDKRVKDSVVNDEKLETRSRSQMSYSSSPVRRKGVFGSNVTCNYCKKKGHLLSECRALKRKESKHSTNALTTVTSRICLEQCEESIARPTTKQGGVAFGDYEPFISKGFVYIDGSERHAVTILRDTGASQTLLLDNILPLSDETLTGEKVLIQGVELGYISVPLHKVHLESDLFVGPITVGVRPTLPVTGVALLLGNDVAGSQVAADPRMIAHPELSVDSCLVETKPDCVTLYPACAVTRAMRRKIEKCCEEDVKAEAVPSDTSLADSFFSKLNDCEEGDSLAQFDDCPVKSEAVKSKLETSGTSDTSGRITRDVVKAAKK